MGYVPKHHAHVQEGWKIELLGTMLDARLRPHPLFDANGARMRG
jgi:dimethylglycine dehydrogenase